MFDDLPLPVPRRLKSKRPKTQRASEPGKGDDFQTPAKALDALLPHLKPIWRIWEPACGQGNLLRALRREGYACHGSDIQTLYPDASVHDFFDWEPEHWDCSVTNPPFSVKDAWLARCCELAKPWALLVPYTIFEARPRQALFREFPPEVIFLPFRPEFSTPSGKVGGAWFPVMWLTWGFGIGQQLTFWEA